MLTLDISGALADAIGLKHGLEEADLALYINRYGSITHDIVKERRAGGLAFLDLPYDSEMADKVLEVAEDIRGRFRNFVVLGIGGSALGCIALHSALRHPCYNLREKPRMFFLDNVDPERTKGLLETLDPAETCVNIITKSGSTAETMANMLVFVGWLKDALGDGWTRNVVVTTDPEKGDLRKLAGEHGLTALEVPAGVGGRFSVLSPVGLLSAAVSGISIEKLLEGAQLVDVALSRRQAGDDPAFVYALMKYMLDTEKSKTMSVLMPYSHALRDIADWYRQIWAESLGKKLDIEGNEVHTGQTPIKALGTTDQHSQVQLYAEGPNDKLFTFLRVNNFRESVAVPALFSDLNSCGYLAGASIEKLMDAEAIGTLAALRDAKRPCFVLQIEEINEQATGALLYFLEVVTAYSGKLYNVNAFDQPGVEAGKVAAHALMGRKGYAEKRSEIEAKLKSDPSKCLNVVEMTAIEKDDVIDVS